VTRAFVAGATGYTGSAVVAALRERGLETVAHVRPDSARLDQFRKEFSELGASVDVSEWKLDALSKTLRELAPDLVFALLGTTKKRISASTTPESYDSVDYGLSALLLHAAKQCEPMPRFVYLSAAGVTPRSRGAYYRARSRMEIELVESGVPYVIARPSFITGDRREPRAGESLAATLSDAALSAAAALGGRRVAARYRSMTASKLAQGLVRGALAASGHGVLLEAEDLRQAG
jgi:nucleoside-diphosphate-sugar epimerase